MEWAWEGAIKVPTWRCYSARKPPAPGFSVYSKSVTIIYHYSGVGSPEYRMNTSRTTGWK
jgi:hypothetical protein